MELLKEFKNYLDEISECKSEFNGIEKEIWICIIIEAEDLFIQVISNIEISSKIFHHKSCSEQNQNEFIDIICELILVFGVFKPYFYYRILKLRADMVKNVDNLNIKFVEWLTSIKPELIIFKSEIYYANKIYQKSQLLVIKNYFSVPLDHILQSCKRIRYKNMIPSIYSSIFTINQRDLGFSSLIVLLELKNNIITLIDYPELYDKFEPIVNSLHEQFSFTLEKEVEKPSCYLNFRIRKNFKKYCFDHHQTICILIKITGNFVNNSYEDIFKENKIITGIKRLVMEQLEIYKNKYDCELFDNEKTYISRKMLEFESQEVANLLLDIEHELETNQLPNYIPELMNLNNECREDAVSTITQKLVHNLLKINN